MKILCTFPGKSGDLLWALPSIRAIAEAHGEERKVDLEIPRYLGHMLHLLEGQPYLRRVWVNNTWEVEFSAPVTPWEPPRGRTLLEKSLNLPVWHWSASGGGVVVHYDQIFHLGYRGWPMEKDLATSTWVLAKELLEKAGLCVRRDWELDLRPWIKVSSPAWSLEARAAHWPDIVVGISEEWIELKMGVVSAVESAVRGHAAHTKSPGSRPGMWSPPGIETFGAPQMTLVYAPGQRHADWRWHEEHGGLVFWSCSWSEMAWLIYRARLFLGCLSAPWVLANALGKETVIFEPAEARHHPVFWHEHPRNQKVDWDARAVVKAVQEKLGRL